MTVPLQGYLIAGRNHYLRTVNNLKSLSKSAVEIKSLKVFANTQTTNDKDMIGIIVINTL